jgi:hypothetical protein
VGEHPVKVPAELVKEWMAEFYGTPTFIGEVTTGIANKAAQWGADQELDACCEWVGYPVGVRQLRAARRPSHKSPTLAEQGMEALRSTMFCRQCDYDAMFAALTRLAELEAQQ